MTMRYMMKKEVERYVVEIISAILVLHSVGIIHRDIKPGNVFLTKEGKCKLGLFVYSSFINELIYY
jgi:serine/threonine protein kinase